MTASGTFVHDAMTRWRLTFVVVLAVLFGLSIGCLYPYGDQNQYLLLGLRLKDPGFIKGDWFTWQTPHHHKAFGYLIWLLTFLGPLPWVCYVAHLIVSAAFALGVWLLIAHFYERPALPYAISLVLVSILARKSILSARLLQECFVPANISSALLVLGVAALLYERFVVAGVLFGATSLFHGNYLFVLPLAVGPVLFVMRKRISRLDLVKVILPFAILSFPVAQVAFSQFMFEEGGFQNKSVLFAVRSPHHYLPLTWSKWKYLHFLGLVALGFVGVKIRRPEKGNVLAARALLLSMVAAILAALALTSVVFVPLVAAIYAFRLAPFVAVAALIAAAGGFANLLEPETQKRTTPAWTLFASAWAMMLMGDWVRGKDCSPLMSFLLILFLGSYVACSSRPRILAQPADRLPKIMTLAMLGVLAFVAVRGVKMLNLDCGLGSQRGGLCSWISSNTPEDAVFIVPPQLEGFRIAARRAIVVDWKCFSMRARDAREWLRRMTLVCGEHHIESPEEAERGYRDMNKTRAQRLVREFDAHWLLMENSRCDPAALNGLKKQYSDSRYTVYYVD